MPVDLAFLFFSSEKTCWYLLTCVLLTIYTRFFTLMDMLIQTSTSYIRPQIQVIYICTKLNVLDFGRTTGIRGFAECCLLCRVPFVGHSLPSVTLGKAFAECFEGFAECFRHSAKRLIPVVSASIRHL
jgi:hypothetical protein